MSVHPNLPTILPNACVDSCWIWGEFFWARCIPLETRISDELILIFAKIENVCSNAFESRQKEVGIEDK